METTMANAWVQSYLDALLSRGGLSSENLVDAGSVASGARLSSAFNDDDSITARYYVNQILSLDEDRIKDAWNKASHGSKLSQAARDARVEHLSWRVWGMKRKRAQVQEELAAERREAALMEEVEDEVDATTLRTIDDLNSTALAAFEECGIAGVAPFGSVAIEALAEEGLEGVQVDEVELNPEQVQQQETAVGDVGAAAQIWKGVKEYSTAPPTSAPPGLPILAWIPERSATPTMGPTSVPPKVPTLAINIPARQAGGDVTGASPVSRTASGNVGSLVSPFASMPPSPFAGSAPPPLPGQGTPPNRAAMQTGDGAILAEPPTPSGGPPQVGAAGDGGAITPVPSGPDPLLVSRFPRLYVMLISLHGLVRGEKMELGKDPDTGGQVKYVVELAKALAQFPSVARVDLLTRLIKDPAVDPSYGEPEERLNLPPLPPASAAVAAAAEAAHYGILNQSSEVMEDGASADGASPTSRDRNTRGAFIVRLPCGPSNAYLRKEDLWPHVREFADRAIAHAQATLQRLQESGEGPCELYVVHGHYADAGEVAALVSSSLGVDCVLTGHSLGRNKREHLLKAGNMSTAEIEATYRIGRRIEAEERALDAASIVFTSTHQEVAEQWGTYDGYSDELLAALQLRPCKGYHVPRMAVIPPGLDFSNLKVTMPADPWEEILGTLPAAVTSGIMSPTNGALTPAGNSLALTPGMSRVATSTRGLTSPQASHVASPCKEAAAANAGSAFCNALDCDGKSPSGPLTPHRVFSGESPSCDNSHTLPTVKMPLPKLQSAAEPTSTSAAVALHTRSNDDVAGVNDNQSESAETTAVSSTGRQIVNLIKGYGNAHGAQQPPMVAPTSESLLMGSHGGAAVPAISPHLPGTPPLEGPLVKRISRGGAITPKSSFAGAAAEALAAAGGSVAMSPSRRVSHSGGAMTPGSVAPGNALAAGHMNPRLIAALMVGDSEPPIWQEINRFLRHPGRPVILAMSRPDAKKNILGLVKAYGQSKVLRDLANLVLVMGNRDVIDGMAPGSAKVLNDVLKLVDTYDLYGQVAYPKKHSQADISDIYLMATATRGVFVNVALQEPFGLTLIEAAAHGAPIVATRHGGPVDIVRTLGNGVLVEPSDTKAISDALIALITSQRLWEDCSEAGRKNIIAYSWPSHCARYLRTVQDQKNTHFMAGRSKLSALYGPLLNDAMKRNTGGPRIRHTFSLSYDDLSSVAHALATSANTDSTNVLADAVASVAAASGTSSGANKSAAVAATDNAATAAVKTEAAAVGDGSAADKDSISNKHYEDNSVIDSDIGGCDRAGSMPALSVVTARNTLSVRTRRNSGLLLPGSELLTNALNSLPGSAAESSNAKDLASSKAMEGAKKLPVAVMDALEEAEHEGDASLAATPMLSAELSVAAPVQLQPKLMSHQSYVVFCVDTAAQVKAVAPALRALLNPHSTDNAVAQQQLVAALLNPAAPGGVAGVGFMCQWGHKDARKLLEAEGVDPLSLDFMACHAGAMIWHSMAAAPASFMSPSARHFLAGAPGAAGLSRATSTDQQALLSLRSLTGGTAASLGGGGADQAQPQLGTSWECDDEWEKHVEFRWDGRVVQQVLRRILDNKTGWGKLHIVRPSASAAAINRPATQPTGTTAVGMRLSPKSSPLHFMLDIEVGGGPGGKAGLPLHEVAHQLVSAIRRKLRMSGVRAQISVTPRETLPIASSGDDSLSRANSTRGIRGGALASIAGSLLRPLQNLAGTARIASPNGDVDGTAGNTLASMGVASRGSLVVHITPLRCSRSLALRFLSARFRRSLDAAWTVVLPAALPDGSASPTAGQVLPGVQAVSTDAEDLVAGVQQVRLMMTTTGNGERAHIMSLPVDLQPFAAPCVQAGSGNTTSSHGNAAQPSSPSSRVQIVLMDN